MAMLQRLGDHALCPINSEKMRIGRISDNEIIMEDDSVSGHHAVIIVKKPEDEEGFSTFILKDLGSTNKTYVNNKEITEQELIDGDVIRIGRTRLKFTTQEYELPNEDFEKTRQLSGNLLKSFFFGK